MKKILAKEKTVSEILGISERRVRDLFQKDKNGHYNLIFCFQEYLKQARIDSGEFVSEKTLSEILCVSDRTIRTLTNRNVLQKTSEGKYELKTNLQAYIKNNDETTKLKKSQREMSELKLKVYKNEYHKASDIEHVMTMILSGFKSKLLNMPRKIIHELKNSKYEEWEEIIDSYVRETLIELSEYDEKLFNSENILED